jgi:CheY-like chemotaxis protein
MMSELKRILIAEDNANDLELTLAALSGHNLANEIIAVRDGAEALDYLHSRGVHTGRPPGLPVVMLLDIKMPKVSGIEVLREVKADPDLRTVPVVMLTSSREDADLIESYKLGVNAYVVKPVEFTEFMAAVRQLGGFWGVLNEVPRELGRP